MIFLDCCETASHLIEAFHAWLENFDAVDDENRLLERLRHCHQLLPAHVRRQLGLPPGSTYAEAAELFLSPWAAEEDS